MNLEEFKILFLVVTIGLAFIAASPVISVIVPFEHSSEMFSEFWVLGSDNFSEDFYHVGVSQEHEVTVGVGNYMGSSQYYLVYLKISNSTGFLPDIEGSVASSLPPICEFRSFISNGDVSESVYTFSFENVVLADDVLNIEDIVVNGTNYSLNVFVGKDSKIEGYPLYLFFELWRYDVVLGRFQFDDLFVGLWINVQVS